MNRAWRKASLGLRVENSQSDVSVILVPSSLKLGAQGGKTIKMEAAWMAAAVQEVSSQTGRRGLGGPSLRPGCGGGEIKVEQGPEGSRNLGSGIVSVQSLDHPQPSRAQRGGGKEAREP